MIDEDSLYPLEIVLFGTPLSLQTKSRTNSAAWKQRVQNAARARQRETYELGLLDHRALAVTIYYFTAGPMVGDIDNIVKPIMDAMIGIAYLNDRAVERVAVQKFEPVIAWEFLQPSEQLVNALNVSPPLVYIRVDDDLSWRRVG